jgi:hypothetical protein
MGAKTQNSWSKERKEYEVAKIYGKLLLIFYCV